MTPNDGTEAETGGHDDALRRVIEDVVTRRLAGESLPDDHVIAEHPELMPELAGELKKVEGILHARRRAREEPATVESKDDGPSETQDATTTPDSVAAITDALPGYTVLREIHRGAQGIVYQAVQESTKRKVAVKLLLEGPYASRSARKRFEREIELVAQLKHPNIICIFHAGVTQDDRQFCVMDYVRGVPLNQYVRDKKLTMEDTLELFATVCKAVNYAHQKGVIHRDLKPNNILVDADGSPKVLDFGLAKQMADREQTLVSVTGQVVGTLPYMSPEQARGNPDEIDIRTDVYALGVILYELLTGVYPYPVVGQMAEVLRHIADTPPTPPSRSWKQDSGITQRSGKHLRPGVCPIDDETQTMVLRALSKERDRRYQSAGELARDIGHYLAGEAIEAKRDSAWYILKKSLRRQRLRLGVGATFLIAIMITAAAYSHRLETERANRLSDEQKALDQQARRTKETSQLVLLLSRALGGIAPEESKITEQLLASYADRLRKGALDDIELKTLARLLITASVENRKFVEYGTASGLMIVVRNRPSFWLPDIATKITPTFAVDGVPSRSVEASELYNPRNSSVSTHWVSVDKVTQDKGLHTLTGSLHIEFVEHMHEDRRSRRPPTEIRRMQRSYGECSVPIPDFEFTVTDSVAASLGAIDDEELARDLSDRIAIRNLAWIPGYDEFLRPHDRWSLEILSRPVADLAFEVELRDAEGRLLGTGAAVVDRTGQVRFGGYGQELDLLPATDLERFADGTPNFTTPIAVKLVSSRRVALKWPKLTSFLVFSTEKKISGPDISILRKLAELQTRMIMTDDLLAAVNADHSLRPDSRRKAIAEIRKKGDRKFRLIGWSWRIVRFGGATPQAYAAARRAVENATTKANGYFALNTLGAAKYRTGAYQEALQTLEMAKLAKFNRPGRGDIPANVAFIAMTLHQLGRTEETGQAVSRLRALMEDSRWTKDKESLALVREAEALIVGD